MREIHRNVQDAASAIRDVSFEQRREKIERWLSPPNPSTNYNRALQQRQEGTGLWFLQSHVYTQWKIQRNSTLWLYGIPGCGKTILSSTIIEDLEKTFPPQIFCTSTLISAMIASRPRTVWCDPLSVSSTARVEMRGSNWICFSPPVKMEIVNQHSSHLVRFSYR